MLKINLDLIMTRRNIPNPRKFLIKQLKINHVTATKLLKGNSDLIRLSYINAICTELRCTPDELFEWEQQKDEMPLPENHPLQKLAKRKEEEAFWERIRDMSPDELREVMKKI
ncbi:MAG TPA: helix-turn-helix transcriptional regulator [Dysgonamonadaceae bacterium]|jgi:putative transcriptional regulator|uniref:helix-turn-helix domain-containing protein n=1 Tax=Seramator thermalis TaxID=2496270 RepID=UPI000C716A57|nr:helix-turn-helix transcriptional regulator [Seramator thermalis]MBZ4657538.1 Cro/C1-type DNA-binding domain [Methermicoccus sp.]MBZ4674610.1 Cro/C1-type DNA-binding domain [Dysgonamonadaceae bacterium]MDI3505641.1 hypothetical protein [Bacteroidota bacterium]MDK2838024.1 hypothetical protein [Bacteroidota bacterium]MDK2969843.1 hypothetical protein [Bacteroidota bacterium]